MASKLDDPKYLASLPAGGSREFFTAAKQFLNKHNLDWFVVREKSKQHQAWRQYFQHREWSVWFMRQLNRGELQYAMFPAEWPEIFDPDYVGGRDGDDGQEAGDDFGGPETLH